ncbi:MAG: Hpt domain-containing protein, partial [Chromatiaceae bacterium]|nr:Hpt domain-containing protein [Candidatus Thioaporhodococcus sediminis]
DNRMNPENDIPDHRAKTVSPPVGTGATDTGGRHLDPQRGLALMGGNGELYNRVLASFVQTYAKLRLDLDNPESRRGLHSLKGLCGHVGASRLQELAAALEKNGDEILLASFYRELSLVLVEIRALLAAGNPGTPLEDRGEIREEAGEEASMAIIRHLIAEIRRQAQAGNSRRCREAIDRLAALDLQAPQAAQLDQARRLLEQRNYLELQKLPLAGPN